MVALPRWVLLPSLAWLTLFFVIPVLGVFVISVGTPVGYSGVQLGFDLSSFEKVFSSTFLGVFVRTIGLAVVGTTLVFLIGFPTAYWLARYGGRRKYLILAILVIPFWTSFIVRTFAWLIVLSPDWFVVRAIESTGIVESFRPLGTIGAVGMVVVYNYLPLALLPLYATLERMNWSMVEAAEDLGATGRGAFFQVTLPLAIPGVATGSMLVFILLMGDYILPQYLGGGKVFFIGNALVDLFLQSRNWPFGAAVSVALVAIMFVTIFLYMRFVLSRGDQRRAALV